MTTFFGSIPLSPSGGFSGFGKIGLENSSADQSGNVLTQILSTAIGGITLIAFLYFMLQFFIGAVDWIASGGDKVKVGNARDRILHAVQGLVITVVAIFLIDIIGKILGISILNPAALIENIALQ
jgi:hypothetical protein